MYIFYYYYKHIYIYSTLFAFMLLNAGCVHLKISMLSVPIPYVELRDSITSFRVKGQYMGGGGEGSLLNTLEGI